MPSPIKTEATVRHWTQEREARRAVIQAPDPHHLAILRAGIAQFRHLLESSTRKDP